MKFWCTIALLTTFTAQARTGDVSFEFEVQQQLEQINDREPQSIEAENEVHEINPAAFRHYRQYHGDQGQEQEQ